MYRLARAFLLVVVLAGPAAAQSVVVMPPDTSVVAPIGADATGVGDSTAAVQQALTAAAGNVFYCPPGSRYKITGNLVIPATVKAIIAYGCTFDASTAPIVAPGLISQQGSISGSLGAGLAAGVSAGATSLTFNAASHGLSPGDLIILHNPADGSWHPSRVYYRQGEFLQVKEASASSATITVDRGIRDTYPGTAVVYRVTPVSTKIWGLKIIGNPSGMTNLPTVAIYYSRDLVIEDVEVDRPMSTAIYLYVGYAPRLARLQIGKWGDDAGLIQSSGVILGSVQHARVRDSVIYSARHAVAMGGGGLVVDRDNLVEKSHLSAKHNYSADFHGAAEDCEYRENRIIGGVTLAGTGNRLIRNRIYQGPAVTTLINLDAMRGLDATIEENEFYLAAGSWGYVLDGSAADDVDASTDRAGTLRLNRNKVFDTTALNGSYVNLVNSGSTASLRLEVTGNEFWKTDTTKFAGVMAVSVAGGSQFASIAYEGNRHYGTFWGSAIADELVVRGNAAIRAAADVADSALVTVGGQIAFENNHMNGGGRVTLQGSGISATLIVSRGNTIFNTTRNYPVLIGVATVVVSQGNVIGNPADATQVGPIYLSTIGDLTITNDEYRGEGAPAFDTVTGVRPSTFSFQKTVTLNPAATDFGVWTIPANMSFYLTSAQGRADADVTATNGDYWSLGVDGANRRADFGVCVVAAAANKHSKNAKFRFASTTATANQMVDAAEVLKLMSVNGTGDAAVLANAMGGAGESITVRVGGYLVGNLPSLP